MNHASFDTSSALIMIIDDDPTLTGALQPLLVDHGFSVMAARSPAYGLNLLRQHRDNVKLVILDYYMPGLTGDQTLRYIREFAPSAKVLGLTGVSAAGLPPTYRAGVDQLVCKPFHSDHLVSCIRQAMGLSRRDDGVS
jgi:DNA-binding response OmpR family regulator